MLISTWTISINEKEVFKRVTNESLYNMYMRAVQNPKGDMAAIQDDDEPTFHRYYQRALADLQVLLARRMEFPGGGVETDEDTTTFYLRMSMNHEPFVLQPLAGYCLEFIIKKVLEQWYLTNFGSEAEREGILHCLHFRRKSVSRRINPVI
jgi:hypothetical protein